MLSDDTKTLIDAMPREDLVEEINRQTRSRFQGDGYAYLKTRLALLDEQTTVLHQNQELTLAEDSNRISAEANRLASKANEIASAASATAANAYRISVWSVVVALLAIVITVVSQCTGKP